MTSALLRSLADGFRKRSQDLDKINNSASYWYALASIDYRYAADQLDDGNDWRRFMRSARDYTRTARLMAKSGKPQG